MYQERVYCFLIWCRPKEPRDQTTSVNTPLIYLNKWHMWDQSKIIQAIAGYRMFKNNYYHAQRNITSLKHDVIEPKYLQSCWKQRKSEAASGSG